jgi:hypothetical protein
MHQNWINSCTCRQDWVKGNADNKILHPRTRNNFIENLLAESSPDMSGTFMTPEDAYHLFAVNDNNTTMLDPEKPRSSISWLPRCSIFARESPCWMYRQLAVALVL